MSDWGARLTLLALIVLPACRRSPPSPAPSPSPSPIAQPRQKSSPLMELATTDPGIALGNLEAQIAAQEHLLAADPRARAPLAALVSLLAMRGQYLRHLADYDQAQAL